MRDVGTEALGTLMKLCGERAIKSHLEKVDPLKMSKIQEAFQKANVATVSGMGSAPASAAPSRPQSSAPVRKTATTSGISGNASSASLKKTPAVSRPASAKVGGAAATPALAQISGSASSSRSDLSVSVQFKFSEGAVESHALDYLSEADWAQLDDSAWKLRLETMDRLIDAIKARPDMDESVEPEILLRLLKKRAVWKDNNFQVIQRLFELIPLLNVKGKISTASASMVIPVLTEKLGDVKLKPSAQAALTTLAERCTLDFVLSRSRPCSAIFADALA